MANTADERVMALLVKVKDKRAEIKSLGRPDWQTNLSFGYNPESVSDRINLQVVSSVAKLVEIYSFLLCKDQQWATAIQEMNLGDDASVKEPTWLGFTTTAWKKDLALRASVLGIEKKKKELAALEVKINSLVSPEQRRELELADLEKELG